MYRFNPPPGWPQPPTPSWTPPPDWRPDPAWPPAPEGWQWYLPLSRPPSAVGQVPASLWVAFWLLVSSLLIMAAPSACADGCSDTLVWVAVLGTWAVELALLALWTVKPGALARYPDLLQVLVVIGIPLACVGGYYLLSLA